MGNEYSDAAKRAREAQEQAKDNERQARDLELARINAAAQENARLLSEIVIPELDEAARGLKEGGLILEHEESIYSSIGPGVGVI